MCPSQSVVIIPQHMTHTEPLTWYHKLSTQEISYATLPPGAYPLASVIVQSSKQTTGCYHNLYSNTVAFAGESSVLWIFFCRGICYS